jgi:hypothetical protein
MNLKARLRKLEGLFGQEGEKCAYHPPCAIINEGDPIPDELRNDSPRCPKCSEELPILILVEEIVKAPPYVDGGQNQDHKCA